MSEQIDWSKAPEDATHCWARAQDFFKLDHGNWMVWYGNQMRWAKSTIAERWSGLVERPTTPSWSGEGLPPVGTVCEVEYDDGRQIWHEAEVIYHKKDGPRIAAARLIGDGRDKLVWVSQFRPIRTPEQIESDARIKAAQEWLKSIGLEYGEDVADQCENILIAAEAKRMDKL